MSKRKVIFQMIGISLVAVLVLTACNLSATTIAPVSATATPVATQAPIVPVATATTAPAVANSPTPNATATVAATATEMPTATTQLTAQVVPAINAYCRKGPGTGYYEITYLQNGTAYNVIGRNGLNTWWLVQAPGNVNCWMGDPDASQLGPVQQASIVMVPPLPLTPSTFVNTTICDTTLHTLRVLFNWSDVQYATGYRIYRNGSQLIAVGPSAAAYGDNTAPLGVKLVYELEAFNDYGVAPRASVTVAACD